MHANDHSDNVLHANNNSLEHDNSALELLKHENDRLMELLISQDLVHTPVNFLATINDYKYMEQSFLDEYEENLKIQTELVKNNDMIEKAVYNELLKRYAPEFKEFFIINELQAQLEAKNVSIAKLKDHIAKIKGNNVVERVSSSTEASGSKPRSNTRKDKISQNSSSNKKINKVEAHLRIDKSSLNNMNRVSKITCNENVKYSVLNANSELVYATYHECMFDAIHDLCVSGYLNDVNAHVKSKNDQIAKIMGYCDYQLGYVTIPRVYYVEDGDDLLSGSRDTNLYTISLDDMLKSSPICLLSKASKTKAGYGTDG
ncbi:hypothetical protein Tco_0866084, partial [Tanacetum coccineum]